MSDISTVGELGAQAGAVMMDTAGGGKAFAPALAMVNANGTVASLGFGRKVSEHTVGDTALPAGVLAVFFNADGTCDIENADESAVAGIPFTGGAPLPFIPAKITAMTTATKCWLVT